MAGKPIKIELPEELWAGLSEVADALGISTAEEAAVIAIAEWIGRRKAELDDRDPARRERSSKSRNAKSNRKIRAGTIRAASSATVVSATNARARASPRYRRFPG